MTKSLLCLAGLLALTGCATVINGPYQTISVDSFPTGAKVTADCGRSTLDAGITPAKLRAERAAEHCVLTFTHDGYDERVVTLSQAESGATRLNAVFGVPTALVAGAAGFAIAWALDDGDALGPLTFGGLALGYVVGKELADNVDENGGALKWVPGKVYAILLREGESEPPPGR